MGSRRTPSLILPLAAAVVMILVVCQSFRLGGRLVSGFWNWLRSHDPSLTLTTGYCNCGKCCGWVTDGYGYGQPIYDYGPLKGKPKKVGVTASGGNARHGTVAADPKVFPFGTRLEIPGYGVGIVEDVGGSIKGRHIDLWFPSHEEARKWGARWLKVKVRKRGGGSNGR